MNSHRFIVTSETGFLRIEHMLGWPNLEASLEACKRRYHPSYTVAPLYGVCGGFGSRAKELGFEY